MQQRATRSASALTLVAALNCIVALTGCAEGSDNNSAGPDRATAPPASSPPSEPSFVESDACRDDARPILDILEMALMDDDPRDVASRMKAIEDAGTSPTALCSAAVAAPIREATTSLNCALDLAIAGMRERSTPDCAADIGEALTAAHEAVAAAGVALDARGADDQKAGDPG